MQFDIQQILYFNTNMHFSVQKWNSWGHFWCLVMIFINTLTDCWHYHPMSSLRMVGDPIRSDKTGEEAVPLWPNLKVLVFSVPLWFGMDTDILSAFPPKERLQCWGGRGGRCLQHINDRISQCLWRWFQIGHHQCAHQEARDIHVGFASPPPHPPVLLLCL